MNTAHHHQHDQLSTSERVNQARAIVEGVNERFTPLRAHVLELIIEDGKAVKAYDLLDRLRPDVGSPKPPTVYRALEFLSRHGLIHRVEALNAFIACDHNHVHDHAHDHGNGSHRHLAEFFICEKCHDVEEALPVQSVAAIYTSNIKARRAPEIRCGLTPR